VAMVEAVTPAEAALAVVSVVAAVAVRAVDPVVDRAGAAAECAALAPAARAAWVVRAADPPAVISESPAVAVVEVQAADRTSNPRDTEQTGRRSKMFFAPFSFPEAVPISAASSHCLNFHAHSYQRHHSQ